MVCAWEVKHVVYLVDWSPSYFSTSADATTRYSSLVDERSIVLCLFGGLAHRILVKKKKDVTGSGNSIPYISGPIRIRVHV